MSPSNPPSPARARATVDLHALRDNAATIARLTGSRLLPMVKADAYGLGAEAVVRALEGLDPWGFGVATLSEAAVLRAAGTTRPVVVFCPLVPPEAGRARALGVRPVIGDFDALEAWVAGGGGPFHVELDTGMARSGFQPEVPGVLDALRARVAGSADFEGLFTHFHSADHSPSAAAQWAALLAAAARFARRPPLVHAANSTGALAGRAFAGDLVRPGIFLYGGRAGAPDPRPVLRLSAPVIAVRALRAGATVSYGATWTARAPTWVATLGLGYGDGLPRSLARGGVARLGGRDRSIIGRITMDMTMVEVDEATRVGDEAELYGPDVLLDDQAARAGTISYELLTALGSRVPRLYEGA